MVSACDDFGTPGWKIVFFDKFTRCKYEEVNFSSKIVVILKIYLLAFLISLQLTKPHISIVRTIIMNTHFIKANKRISSGKIDHQTRAALCSINFYGMLFTGQHIKLLLWKKYIGFYWVLKRICFFNFL